MSLHRLFVDGQAIGHIGIPPGWHSRMQRFGGHFTAPHPTPFDDRLCQNALPQDVPTFTVGYRPDKFSVNQPPEIHVTGATVEQLEAMRGVTLIPSVAYIRKIMKGEA